LGHTHSIEEVLCNTGEVCADKEGIPVCLMQPETTCNNSSRDNTFCIDEMRVGHCDRGYVSVAFGCGESATCVAMSDTSAGCPVQPLVACSKDVCDKTKLLYCESSSGTDMAYLQDRDDKNCIDDNEICIDRSGAWCQQGPAIPCEKDGCDGSKLIICGSNGFVDNSSSCNDGKTCVEANGVVECALSSKIACDKEQYYFCDGNQEMRCGESGYVLESSACAEEHTCFLDPTTDVTSCIRAEMIPCEKDFCEEQTVNICGVSGYVTDMHDCVLLEKCENGECI